MRVPGGDEQAAANHVAHAHATKDDWRTGGRGGGLSLKGTGGLFSEIQASVSGGGEVGGWTGEDRGTKGAKK